MRVADERAIDAYRSGRTCHPLLPFADWAGCAPALGRLGSVVVAGCRDAVAARQLGFVPVRNLQAGARNGPRPRRRPSARRVPALAAVLSDPGRRLEGVACYARSSRTGGLCPLVRLELTGRPSDRSATVARSRLGTPCAPARSRAALFASSARAIVPGLEHVAAVGRVERHQRVLLDEQDRRPLLVDLVR